MERIEPWLESVRWAVGLGVMGVVLVFVLVPLAKALGQGLPPDDQASRPLKPPPDPMPANDSPPSPPEAKKIVELAKQDPLKTAQLVRNWLKEK